jgi:hypothetical protein
MTLSKYGDHRCSLRVLFCQKKNNVEEAYPRGALENEVSKYEGVMLTCETFGATLLANKMLDTGRREQVVLIVLVVS